jgi:hypothetical protein
MADRKGRPDTVASQRLDGILEHLDQAEKGDALLHEVLDAAIDIAGTDMGNIQLSDHDAGSLIIAASRGFSAPFLSFLPASLPSTIVHVAPC